MADNFPPLLWAQRPEWVLLTVPLQDTTDVDIAIPGDGQTLQLACSTPDGKRYTANVELFAPVQAEESQHVVRPRQIELKLKKKESAKDEELEWPRLTKVKKFMGQHIQVDWGKWRDADEGDGEGGDDDLGDFGMGGDFNEKMMQQFMMRDATAAPGGEHEGGAAPAAAKEGDEDDDDDMPPLEEC